MVATAEENTLKDWLETRVFYRHIASILPKKDAIILCSSPKAADRSYRLRPEMAIVVVWS